MTDWGMYKPVLTALAMPPVPFLVLILVGARLILPRRGLGFSLVLMGLVGIWLSCCQGVAILLLNHALKPPGAVLGEPLTRLSGVGHAYAQQVTLARRSGRGDAVRPPAAIIALGSGREAMAPEYGMSDLSSYSVARLRYGVWLSRRTGLPLGFSGGVGWAQQGASNDAPEAEVAARIASEQFGLSLRWVESSSEDTKANAARTVVMLAEQGVPEVVVVTHAFHMTRAVRDFELAAQHVKAAHPQWPLLKVTPAPIVFWHRGEEQPALDWLPSTDGAFNVRLALKELLGIFLGA
ncbi:MAG: YdcF family protein [Aquabacterium sp.]